MSAQPMRPRSSRRRTLPPDATSLEQLLRSVHRKLRGRAQQLKLHFRDGKARQGFRQLYETRAAAWAQLNSLNPQRARQLATELQLSLPRQFETMVQP